MKNLLFIGPKFYNYHEVIKKGFEDAGYIVDYFNDRPDDKFFTKAFIRINKKLLKNKIYKYFNLIKEKASVKNYDVIFVLYGQSFSNSMMLELKKISPNSRFVFYMYDPISSMPDRAEFSQIFDDCYSFDSEDCKKYSNFKFVPLFFSFDNYPIEKIIYDASAILTIMPGKYEKMVSMIKELEHNNYTFFKIFYLQSKLIWLYYKLTKKEFKESTISEFTYKRLSQEKVKQYMSQSKFILDCPKEGQTGLTIRTFEALAANKKLITTNKHVVEYDFYRPENIYVYNGKFDFNNVFFKSEYVPISDEIKANYTINSWVKKVLKNV